MGVENCPVLKGGRGRGDCIHPVFIFENNRNKFFLHGKI